MTPSKYQQEILDWILAPREARQSNNAIVNAVAGAGKTSTLVMAAKTISGHGVFLAFGKAIAETLGEKLQGTNMTAKTIHSLGFSAIRKVHSRTRLDDRKYRFIIDDLCEEGHFQMNPDQRAWVSQNGFPPDIYKLVNLARADLADTEDQIRQVIEHHALDLPQILDEPTVKLVLEAMQRGQAQAGRTIDFGDMVWLPHALNLRPQSYPWVFVDECQDLSAAQRDVVLRTVAAGGRVLAVGDPRQAIYGFAGADDQSFWRLRDALEAEELPLSVCYRCPKTVLALARTIVPQIEDGPHAKPGKVWSVGRDAVVDKVSEGDLILSRYTAPLLKLCWELLQSKISASVKGHDIGKGLVTLAKKISQKIRGVWSANFANAVIDWRNTEVMKLQTDDARVESISDRADCLLAIFESCKAKSLEDLVLAIESLFSEDRPSVVLSTIHRAKGLENDRVFILTLPNPDRAKQDWQRTQEFNLTYVQATRAMKELVFIDLTPGDLPGRAGNMPLF